MPAARVFTPDMRAVSQVVDQALTDPEGVVIFWRVAKYGSEEACAALSRRFANAFTALRARMRRLSAEEKRTQPRDLVSVGPLDRLVCQRIALDNGEGWKVEIFRDDVLTSALEVVSLSSGELLSGVGVGRSEFKVLMEKATTRRVDFTAEDWDRLTLIDENEGEPWHTIGGVQWFPRPGPPLTPQPSTDIAEALAETEDAFGGVDGAGGGE